MSRVLVTFDSKHGATAEIAWRALRDRDGIREWGLHSAASLLVPA